MSDHVSDTQVVPPAPTGELPELKETVGDSFNIYQATVAILALFAGFVFAALFQIVSGDKEPEGLRRATIWILTFAFIALHASLLAYHLTANQIVRQFRIMFPKSHAQRVGSICISLGVAGMYWGLAMEYFRCGLTALGVILLVAPLGLIWFNIKLRTLHAGATYLADVEGQQ